MARIARRTAELIGLGRDLRDDEIEVMEGWAGDLYGIPVESTLEAIRLTGQLEGMIIDPVYEGKSMAGLIDLVAQRRHPEGRPTCSTPTSAASRPSTPTAACSPTAGRPDEPRRRHRRHEGPRRDRRSGCSGSSTRIVDAANRERETGDGVKVGGHQASSASLVTAMTALYFAHLDAPDRVSVKPHASPVFHAIQYLLGNLDRSTT